VTHESRLSAEASAAIRRPAFDYIDGWIAGDADRMDHALHQELVKRSVRSGPDGPAIRNLTHDNMVGLTAAGEGRGDAGDFEIEIVDVHDDIASLIVRSRPYVDYLHVARFGDRWQIVNVLWAQRTDR
jgi:hypothetical protein